MDAPPVGKQRKPTSRGLRSRGRFRNLTATTHRQQVTVPTFIISDWDCPGALESVLGNPVKPDVEEVEDLRHQFGAGTVHTGLSLCSQASELVFRDVEDLLSCVERIDPFLQSRFLN